MWQPLFANLAVVSIALVAWNMLGDWTARLSPLRRELAFGAAMAVATVGSMAMAYQASPGVMYDFRGPLIGISGFFGGWPAALVTAGAALLSRLHLGGAVAAGVLVIAIAALVGSIGHALCRSRRPGLGGLVGLAAAIAVHSLPGLLLLPAPARAALWPQYWGPVLLSFLAALFLGAVLLLERRRRDLAAANTLYRSMVDALPDCLNIKDSQGRFLAANPATARQMQLPSPAALLGKTDFDFHPADLAAAFRADEEQVLRDGAHRVIEQRVLKEDGSLGWLSTLKMPMREEGGRIAGLVTHNRDITEAKRLQAALDQTQAYLDQALENMSDGLAMYGADATLLFCNRRYRELFPRTAHLRVPGARFADLVRASLEADEQRPAEGLLAEEHIARKLATLGRDGEHQADLADGRTLSCRAKVLANGCTLRMVSDVTERRSFEKHLEHQALHDPLTGLPNRACFNRGFARLLGQAREAPHELLVMLLDLDHFKEVNDGHGHAAGDALLVEVARRLQGAVRPGDLVARLGGDEFALLIPCAAGINDAGFAARLMKKLTPPMRFGGVVLTPGGTAGYTLVSEDLSDADGLLKNADRALYQAKARRRGSWKKWTPGEETQPEALAG